MGSGCHLNRRINELVQQQFSTVTFEQFSAPRLPRVMAAKYFIILLGAIFLNFNIIIFNR
jgi:hypothetical protein